MTHDELLDRIAQAGLEPEGNVMPTYLVLALRAVVELHKPEYVSANEYSGTYCTNCMNMPAPNCYYPCPTIQAIEKELA